MKSMPYPSCPMPHLACSTPCPMHASRSRNLTPWMCRRILTRHAATGKLGELRMGPMWPHMHWPQFAVDAILHSPACTCARCQSLYMRTPHMYLCTVPEPVCANPPHGTMCAAGCVSLAKRAQASTRLGLGLGDYFLRLYTPFSIVGLDR